MINARQILLMASAIALAAGTATAASAQPAAKAPAEDQFAATRMLIDKILKEAKVPSIAVAVVKDGKIIFEDGFGFADVERQVRATAHTPYSLASITKPITATAVMKLHEAGKLDIDLPIERYLGGIKLAGHAGSTAGVTARRIMSHSAGLPLYGHFYLDGSKPADAKETISKFGLVVFEPGTRFRYSNMGMRIVDTAIASVSGQTFGEYLGREVFLPLGMKNSVVALSPRADAAVRYAQGGKPMPFYASDHPGSGDVWASAHDMARFLAFSMGTPLPDQRQILSPATRLQMQKPFSALPMPTPPGAPRRDLGANWILTTVNGHPQMWHSGGQPGVSTFMAFYPDQKLGMVLLSNASAPLRPVAESIRKAVAPELVSNDREEAPPEAQPIRFKGEWKGTVTNYAGEQPLALAFPDKGEIKVTLGSQASTDLIKPSFEDGMLSGRFKGETDIPEARGYPQQLAVELVESNGELIGQLTTIAQNEKGMMLLPSFVRLRRFGEAK